MRTPRFLLNKPAWTYRNFTRRQLHLGHGNKIAEIHHVIGQTQDKPKNRHTDMPKPKKEA